MRPDDHLGGVEPEIPVATTEGDMLDDPREPPHPPSPQADGDPRDRKEDQ